LTLILHSFPTRRSSDLTPTTATVNFADNDNNEEVLNFCITPNGEHKDVEIIVTPLIPTRPGFEATYNIVYRNKGNQVASEYYGRSEEHTSELQSRENLV